MVSHYKYHKKPKTSGKVKTQNNNKYSMGGV